jgi:hypothetical protein
VTCSRSSPSAGRVVVCCVMCVDGRSGGFLASLRKTQMPSTTSDTNRRVKATTTRDPVSSVCEVTSRSAPCHSDFYGVISTKHLCTSDASATESPAHTQKPEGHKKTREIDSKLLNTLQHSGQYHSRTYTMVTDALSYETISTVVETWEEARRTPAFQETLGMKTLIKYVMMMR